ncbi:MAG: hypothetical protein PHP32_03025 [Candidatus Izemoplasmatales bacterium]|nr:hypothetical protein [Candidatus Izemoplasmatales bacterium]
MNNNPEIKKDVWDARGKIVIGNFIIITFNVAFALAIFGLLLEHFVFGGGDAFMKPYVYYFGLPISAIVCFIAFQVSYKPKKRKIDLFEKQMIDFQQGLSQVAGLTRHSTVHVISGIFPAIRYTVYRTEEAIVMYPCKPDIAELDGYISKGVEYHKYVIAHKDILRMEVADPTLVDVFTYDQKKKITWGKETIQTAKIWVQNVSAPFVIEKTIITATPVPMSTPKTGGNSSYPNTKGHLQLR